MNHSDDRVPVRLTSLPAAIKAAGYQPVEYRLIRETAINAIIPAHQRQGIWHYYAEDAGEIVKVLKLPRLAKPVRRKAA